ncbi:FtsH protease activity modulator HflK [Stakelama saccharophila]|uniref:Protein HflK n=1 Tax=Stakelama saccharophila TaxID=3075605 RepID=A0ABZ0B9X0_9SPHN|nr:FtsH protease activity modulator HflK [Stakelama sp. W311]WNO54148.1 FtsH protease activity modulator HflK [Stakelama sp. W311]
MAIFTGWLARSGVLMSADNKGPWGNGGGNGSDDDGGPRNPWQFPPQGRRQRGASVSSLDEFLKRARGGGGGSGGDGGPGRFQAPGGRNLWLLGIGVILVLWFLVTSFHAIGPQQKGVVTFFGNYTRTLDSGVQMTWPAPINAVRKVDVERIRDEVFPTGNGENLMLTGDQNIVNLSYLVRWNVRSPQRYVFEIKNTQEVVRAVAESAMREVVATVTLDEVIGAGRSAIEARVQQRMQELLNDYRAGVEVQGVSVKNASPPAAVDEAFKAVTAAQQQAQANLNQARAYAQQVRASAQGQAAEFNKIYEQYRLAPEVTKRRLYYETMEKVLANTDKTIVEPDGVVPYLVPPGSKKAPETTVTAPSSGGGDQ